MKEYIVTQSKDGSLIIKHNDTIVSATDILTVYPASRVYALRGAMGAGKTTFTKQLCEDLGSNDIVNSPTFAIVNVYEDRDGQEIYHFDCYRLKNIQEALNLGAEDYLYSGNYCFIEWPEQIEELLPDNTVNVNISTQADGSRKLCVTQ